MKTIAIKYEKGLNFEVYSSVVVEPTDESLKQAIEYCKNNDFDAFVAVGGGSVIG